MSTSEKEKIAVEMSDRRVRIAFLFFQLPMNQYFLREIHKTFGAHRCDNSLVSKGQDFDHILNSMEMAKFQQFLKYPIFSLSYSVIYTDPSMF